MVPNTNWAKILGISEQELAKYSQECNGGQPLPYYLMLSKKIDENTYLKWARNEYSLASLDRAYFLNPHDAELWYTMKIEHHWTPWLVPLKIWDNTLFVGCVQPPPAPIKISLPVHYVLCPAAGLERIWKFYMGDMGVEVTMKSKLTSVTAPQQQPMPEPAPEPTAIIFEPEPAPERTAIIPEPPPQPQAKAPEDSKTDISGIDFAGLVIASGKTVPKPREKVEKQVYSDGVLDFSNIKINKPEEPKAATPAPAPAPQKPPAPPQPTIANFEITKPNITKPTMPTSPPPPPARPTAPPPQSEPNFTLSPMPAPSAKPTPTMTFPTSVAAPVAPPSIDVAKNLDELVAYTFKEMGSYYEKSFLATYEDGKLLVSRWSPNVTPNPQLMSRPLTVDRPNVFKIAHDTKKPYHGPVSANEINKSFFEAWNSGQIPANLTIFPLFDGKVLMGHLVGICNKELDVYATLEFMGKLAEAFTNKTKAIAA